MTDEAAPRSGGADLKSLTYKECLGRVDATIAQLSSCDDVDEFLRLVREGEACLMEAQRRIAVAEESINKLFPEGRTE